MGFEWCKEADKGLPAPDLVLFLDLPVEEASKRGEFGKERYEKVEFQKEVKNAYSKLKDDTWVVRVNVPPFPVI